jgi:hypothetical protein
MDSTFDINKIATDFIENRYKELIKIATGVAEKGKDQISLILKEKYKQYLISVSERYCKTKSFFIRDEAVPLKDFYVPLGIKSKDTTFKTATLDKLLIPSRFNIIKAYGGSGKSILLKYFLLSCLEKAYKIPVYIELRDLSTDQKSLKDFIFITLGNFGLDLENNYYEKSLKKGHYIVFLDGLDEVTTEVRDSLTKDINDFTKKYSNCDIIITTRPDDRVSQLEIFRIYNLIELDLEKSISLINKLPTEEVLKEKFIGDLKNGLFEKHKSFLSNPLLLSIMLLTYGYSADIPNKLSIFYNQAYEALFQRHDALKGAYKRNKETDLDIQEFEKVLSSFCIQSYDKRKIKFSSVEALEYIDEAKKLTNLQFKSNAYLADLLQAVCILVEDGIFLLFTHRSFQEYFAARFIIKCSVKNKSKLLNKYITYAQCDNLFTLVHDMDTEFIESEVYIPFISEFFTSIGFDGIINKKVLANYLQRLYSAFEYHEEFKIVGVINKNMHDYNMIRFIIKSFEKSNELKSKYSNHVKNYSGLLDSIIIPDKPINTIDLNEDHPLLNWFYNEKVYFSGTNILILEEINQRLKEKYKNIENNLEDLLFQ